MEAKMSNELVAQARPKVEITEDALRALNIEAKRRGIPQYQVLSDIVMDGVAPAVREMAGIPKRGGDRQ
jgi:hypothetical protein